MGISRVETDRARSLIMDNDSIAVLSHQNPDGDAFGSALGLGLMLRNAGHSVQVTWPEYSGIPLKYGFLPGREMLTGTADLRLGGLAIVVDCANTDRLGGISDSVFEVEAVINIDHHPDNTFFGSVNLVDPGASAAAEILYLKAGEMGLEIDREVAICLYTGIVTDTGRFQFSNTTARTLRIASEMVELGVNPNRIYEEVYQGDTLSYIRLTGELLSRVMSREETGLVYLFMKQEDLKRFGVEMNETEDLVDLLRKLRGHRIAALFKEQEDGSIRVSLRSRADIDIGTVARSLGGGGHKVAAGYTSDAGGFEEALEELTGEINAS